MSTINIHFKKTPLKLTLDGKTIHDKDYIDLSSNRILTISQVAGKWPDKIYHCADYRGDIGITTGENCHFVVIPKENVTSFTFNLNFESISNEDPNVTVTVGEEPPDELPENQ